MKGFLSSRARLREMAAEIGGVLLGVLMIAGLKEKTVLNRYTPISRTFRNRFHPRGAVFFPFRTALSIISSVTGPSRITRTVSEAASTTVEAGSPGVTPQSSTRSTPFRRSPWISEPLFMAVSPDRLALVAVMGAPNPFTSARATGWLGTLRPIHPFSDSRCSGTSGPAFTTMVNAPGQNVRASCCAASETACPQRLR